MIGKNVYDNYHEFHYEGASCEVTIEENGRGILHRVYSKTRSQGHAKALLTRVISWADENGVELFLRAQAYGHPVQTILDNNQLVRFYERFGFVRGEDDMCGTNIPMTRLPRTKNTPYSEREN